MKKYVRIHLIDHGAYIQPFDELNIVLDELREGAIGDRWELEIIEMREEDYAALPEFKGH